MVAFADQMARLRAHIEGGRPLPPDLGAWTLERIGAAASTDYLRVRRDAWLRWAGELLGGSVRARALGILQEEARLARTWSAIAARSPDLSTARGAVHAARLILPIPAERRVREILTTGARALAVSRLAIPGIESANDAD